MKIIRHTKNCLELGYQDSWIVNVASSFTILFLVVSCISFDTSVILIIFTLILIFGAITANFEMNCQFDRELNLFKLSYRSLIRQKNIERSLDDIDDVRLEHDKGNEGDIFYYLVIMTNSGEEITVPHLRDNSPDIKTCETILSEVKSFIHNIK
jgi:hypothetical protein